MKLTFGQWQEMCLSSSFAVFQCIVCMHAYMPPPCSEWTACDWQQHSYVELIVQSNVSWPAEWCWKMPDWSSLQSPTWLLSQLRLRWSLTNPFSERPIRPRAGPVMTSITLRSVNQESSCWTWRHEETQWCRRSGWYAWNIRRRHVHNQLMVFYVLPLHPTGQGLCSRSRTAAWVGY